MTNKTRGQERILEIEKGLSSHASIVDVMNDLVNEYVIKRMCNRFDIKQDATLLIIDKYMVLHEVRVKDMNTEQFKNSVVIGILHESIAYIFDYPMTRVDYKRSINSYRELVSALTAEQHKA